MCAIKTILTEDDRMNINKLKSTIIKMLDRLNEEDIKVIYMIIHRKFIKSFENEG